MAKHSPIKAPTIAPQLTPPPVVRLEWPKQARDLCPRSRVYRIHRVDAFAWQAYVTDEGQELPIGKPDLFDILKAKVAGCMRAEGQREYLASKAKAESDAQKKVPDAQ